MNKNVAFLNGFFTNWRTSPNTEKVERNEALKQHMIQLRRDYPDASANEIYVTIGKHYGMCVTNARRLAKKMGVYELVNNKTK